MQYFAKLIGEISIHAPPRGATKHRPQYSDERNISIHAPPRGATRRSCPRTRKPTLFQFTPLREGRLYLYGRLWRKHVISIHAPPRGATKRAVFHAWRDFNSRPSARGDGTAVSLSNKSSSISIHAPPRGATIRLCACICISSISIHAPPRGATTIFARQEWTT